VPELEASAAPPPVPTEEDASSEQRRRNPALFWTGMGLTIAGGAAIIVGAALVGESQVTTGETSYEGVGLLIASGALLGVGFPFMVVYGRKQSAEAAVILSPQGASLRVSF
jgi:hypothetical protein